MILAYGRQIKYKIKREKGTTKCFDPRKGYGFLERDKEEIYLSILHRSPEWVENF